MPMHVRLCLALAAAVALVAAPSMAQAPQPSYGAEQPYYGAQQPYYGPPGQAYGPQWSDYGPPQAPGYGLPRARGPFTALAGTWSGVGTIDMANGARERIRCRVTYAVDPSGADLRQTLRCASASTRFDVDSNIAYQNGGISGTWTEANRNATGTVSGEIRGNAVNTRVTGPNFFADLALVTRGNRQSVTIRPQGGGDIAAVSIELRRAG